MSKERSVKRKIVRRIVWIIIAAAVFLSAVIVGMCLFNERPAVRTLEEYRDLYADVTISVADDGGTEIFPLSGEPDAGIIFYVGAQIRPEAYIPLLAPVAEQGFACFIPELSFNMAAVEPNAADDVIAAHPEIGSWILAGHSMGGLTASGYADDHRGTVDGLILIAAYTNRDMSGVDLPTLAVYGDADGVMNQKLYDKRLPWNPADFEEYLLPGANHAQYGDYGRQPRDNDASISADAQRTQTAAILVDWLDRHAASGGSDEE